MKLNPVVFIAFVLVGILILWLVVPRVDIWTPEGKWIAFTVSLAYAVPFGWFCNYLASRR